MKNRKLGVLLFCMLVCTIVTMSFMKVNSPVKGSVTPPDSALRAWLYSGSDTLNTDINQGLFEFKNVKDNNLNSGLAENATTKENNTSNK